MELAINCQLFIKVSMFIGFMMHSAVQVQNFRCTLDPNLSYN